MFIFHSDSCLELNFGKSNFVVTRMTAKHVNFTANQFSIHVDHNNIGYLSEFEVVWRKFTMSGYTLHFFYWILIFYTQKPHFAHRRRIPRKDTENLPYLPKNTQTCLRMLTLCSDMPWDPQNPILPYMKLVIEKIRWGGGSESWENRPKSELFSGKML